MATIFLDIEGVLNSLSTEIAISPKTKDVYYSAVSVGLLKSLCEKTKSHIVLTSAKRRKFVSDSDCIFEMRKTFKNNYNWSNFPIIGRTPFLGTIKNRVTRKVETRGYEIEAWINKNTELLVDDNWIIIDDDAEIKSDQMRRLVQTSFCIGFGFHEYTRALALLGHRNSDYEMLSRMAILRENNNLNIT